MVRRPLWRTHHFKMTNSNVWTHLLLFPPRQMPYSIAPWPSLQPLSSVLHQITKINLDVNIQPKCDKTFQNTLKQRSTWTSKSAWLEDVIHMFVQTRGEISTIHGRHALMANPPCLNGKHKHENTPATFSASTEARFDCAMAKSSAIVLSSV